MTGDLCPVCHDLIARSGADYCDGCTKEFEVRLTEIAAEAKRLTEEHEQRVIAQEERV